MDNNFNGQDGQPNVGQQPYTQPGMNQQPYTQPDMNQQPYTQPDMNQQPYTQPDMNQQMYNQPYMQQGTSAGGKPPKVKKPMTGGRLAGIIGGCAVAVAAVACGIIFIPKLFKSDKQIVTEAFKNTFSVESEGSYLEDTLGYTDIVKSGNENGGTTHVEYGINSIAGDSSISDFEIQMDGVKDSVNKLVNGTFSLMYQDSSLVTVKAIGTEDNTYLQADELIDGYFSLPNKDIFGALETSPLFGEYFESTNMPSIDINYFAEVAADSDTAYEAFTDELWKVATVNKQGNVKVDVNGSSISAKQYNVVVAEEDIENCLNTALEELGNAVSSDPDALSEAGISADDFNSYLDTAKGMVTSLVGGDFVLKVYISNDKVVRVASTGSSTLLGVQMGYDFYFDTDDSATSGKVAFTVAGQEAGLTFDAKKENGGVNGEASLYAADESIDVVFETTSENTDAASGYGINLDFSYGGKSVAIIDFSHRLDKATGSFDGTFSVDVSGTTSASLAYAGAVKDIVKGQSYTMDVNTIDVNVNDENILSMYMSCGVDTAVATATGIDSSLPVYDITTMTESDFEQVVDDNSDRISAWADSLPYEEFNSIAGELEDDTPLDDDYYYEDETDEDLDLDLTEEDDSEVSQDEAILVSGDHKVQILDCIDGFTFSSANEYWVDYYTDNYSFIEYSVQTGTSADDILEYFYVPDESDDVKINEQTANQTLDVDGEVVYSYVQYEYYGTGVSYYEFVKELDDGLCVIVEAYIYDGDSYSAEELAEALSNKCYTVIE